jgi:hypothetical protein
VITYYSFFDQPQIEKIANMENPEKPKNIPSEILSAEQIFNKCEYDMHCSVELLNNISHEEEKPKVMNTFVDLLSIYHKKQSNFRCHTIAHHLGEWVYGYTQNMEESFQYADPLTCGAGIYHGIFENYFSVLKFEGAVPDQVEIKQLCSKIDSGFYSLDMAHCYHGIGHGLLLLYDYDVSNAVKRCKDFNIKLERNSCANGVFMQNVLKNFESGDADFDKNDIQYPCNKIISDFVSTCYIWQGPYILKERNFEVYSSFRECDKINQEFIKYCYYGIGTELETDAGGKMELALKFCQAGNSAYSKDCFRGMLMKTSMIYLDSGFGFCSLVPGQFKEECYDGLGYWINLRYDNVEEREKECMKAENQQYYDVCLNPNIDGITYL